MRKILAILLLFALLMPLVPAKAETVAVKPFYGIGSSDFNRDKFPNLEGRVQVTVGVEDDGEVYLYTSAGRDVEKIASSLKETFDTYPEGMRYITLHRVSEVFQLQEDTIYFEEGVEKLKTIFSQFIKAYADIGGKMDGIVLDVEYVDTHAWYLYSKQYTKGNKDVYKNIVSNPRYKTDVRPMLEERGFKFYPDETKTEIWSIYSRLKGDEATEYAVSQTIWNTVMRIRLNNYMTYAVYEPLAQYMPNTRLYDYQSRTTAAWQKNLNDKGEHNYLGGNSVPVGVTSHYNTYGSRLSNDFFTVDEQPVYNNPVAYNGAEFAATPFNRILWDVNLMKGMYEASGGDISITVAEYDYSPSKVGTPSNTPYYTESIFHIGLLDPEPFCIYMYDKAFETTTAYNKRAKVLQEILAELTRVAGYADREPISVPATWNSSFLLSGIYANGRNLWRFTPDNTQVDQQNFYLAGDNPTFYINGQTITFPQGKIIADGAISVVGSYGYWIETPKNVTPIVTTDADRYSQYPSLKEDFEGYEAGTFDSTIAKPAACWQVSGTATVMQSGNGKALALTGTATVTNEKLPQNITAGDYYAKQQAWEISVTLPDNMAGEVKLLACGDGGIKIADGKAYYQENGTYKELAKLSAGKTYTLKREVDFRSDFQCDYTVYDSSGKVIGQAKAVPMTKIAIPVTQISFSCTNLTGKVLLDDYKLYPTGITTDFELYNAKTGIRQGSAISTENVAYRLSWLNGSQETEELEVVATFTSADSKQTSRKVIQKLQMNPGCDGVETGIVEVPQGQKVVLSLVKVKPTVKPTTPTQTTKPAVAPTEAPIVEPTQGQTLRPTNQQLTKPSATQITMPVAGATVAPTTVPGSVQSTGSVPAEEQETAPTETISEKMTSAPTQASVQSDQLAESTQATKAHKSNEGGKVSVVPIVVISVIALGGAAAVVLYVKKKKSKQ